MDTVENQIRAEAAQMIREKILEGKREVMREMQTNDRLAHWNMDDLHDAMGDLEPTKQILEAVSMRDAAELGEIFMRHFREYAESQRGWKHD